jgi:hypothetical protein
LQNEPNFRPFRLKNSDSAKKQTQSNPIEPNFRPKTTICQKTNPKQTQTYTVWAIWAIFLPAGGLISAKRSEAGFRLLATEYRILDTGNTKL